MSWRYRWGSPLLPYLNGFFASPYAPLSQNLDQQRLPHGPLEALLYPFIWTLHWERVGPFPFRELALPILEAVLFLLLAKGVAVCLRRRAWRPILRLGRRALPRPLRHCRLCDLGVRLRRLPVSDSPRDALLRSDRRVRPAPAGASAGVAGRGRSLIGDRGTVARHRVERSARAHGMGEPLLQRSRCRRRLHPRRRS